MKKIILITGASTGIGAATAICMAAGNHVLIHYNRSKDKAEKVAEKVRHHGGEADLIQADLSTDQGCMKVMETVSKDYGKLDVLVNNAGGIDARHTVQEITWELMEKVFALNTFAVLRLSSACLPLLKKGTLPCIINVTSSAVRNGSPTASVYAAAKGAVDTFTRGLAKIVAPTIRVNSVAPGFVDTPFHEGITSNETLAAVKEQTPLKVLGKSEEIAKAIKMVAENEFMTGAAVDVNGGYYMY